MSTTEIALLPLATGCVTPDFHKICDNAQTTQDGWYAKHRPGPSASRLERAAAMFEQLEDPSILLITALWDSAGEHWEWIGSDENKGTMGVIIPHLDPDYAGKMQLFHVDGVLFKADSAAQKSPLSCPVVSVGRMLVDTDKKSAFVDKFRQVSGILEAHGSPSSVNGGWTIEKKEENTEEFVLVCGWDSVEKHQGFAASAGFAKYSQIRELVRETDTKHYKRVL